MGASCLQWPHQGASEAARNRTRTRQAVGGAVKQQLKCLDTRNRVRRWDVARTKLDKGEGVAAQGDFGKVVTGEDLDGVGVPVLRRVLRHEVALELAGVVALGKLHDGLRRQLVRLRLVLGHLFLHVDDARGRDVVLFQAEELQPWQLGRVCVCGQAW